MGSGDSHADWKISCAGFASFQNGFSAILRGAPEAGFLAPFWKQTGPTQLLGG
jgi:hypothetical protein